MDTCGLCTRTKPSLGYCGKCYKRYCEKCLEHGDSYGYICTPCVNKSLKPQPPPRVNTPHTTRYSYPRSSMWDKYCDDDYYQAGRDSHDCWKCGYSVSSNFTVCFSLDCKKVLCESCASRTNIRYCTECLAEKNAVKKIYCHWCVESKPKNDSTICSASGCTKTLCNHCVLIHSSFCPSCDTITPVGKCIFCKCNLSLDSTSCKEKTCFKSTCYACLDKLSGLLKEFYCPEHLKKGEPDTNAGEEEIVKCEFCSNILKGNYIKCCAEGCNIGICNPCAMHEIYCVQHTGDTIVTCPTCKVTRTSGKICKKKDCKHNCNECRSVLIGKSGLPSECDAFDHTTCSVCHNVLRWASVKCSKIDCEKRICKYCDTSQMSCPEHVKRYATNPKCQYCNVVLINLYDQYLCRVEGCEIILCQCCQEANDFCKQHASLGPERICCHCSVIIKPSEFIEKCDKSGCIAYICGGCAQYNSVCPDHGSNDEPVTCGYCNIDLLSDEILEKCKGRDCTELICNECYKFDHTMCYTHALNATSIAENMEFV